MPEFSRDLPGQFIAGNAGDGGVVSTNDGRIVAGPSAGNAHWLNAREVACQSYGGHPPMLVAVDVFTGAERPLLTHGVNKIVAGSGHWFADKILDGQPVDFNVRAFAGDYMAWFPWDGTGLILRGPAGDVTLSTTLGPEEPIQLFPDGGCLWAEGGTVKAHNLADFPANPQIVPGGFGWVKGFRIGSVWWLAYQSYALASVVCHPATELVGYRWPAPNAFRLDVTVIGNTEPRIVWSRGNADAPLDIELQIVNLSLPRVGLTLPTPVPDPPKPEPPKPMPIYTDNPTATLQALRATYPTPLGSSHAAFLIAACQAVGHGAGLLKKDGGTTIELPNGVTVSQDWMVFPDGFGTDFLSDGEGAATVGWGQLQEYDKSRYVDVSGLGAKPDPKPEPTPSVDLSGILKSIEELTQQVQALAMRADATDAIEIATDTRLVALEQKPLPKLRVSGDTSRIWGHSHKIDLAVIEE